MKTLIASLLKFKEVKKMKCPRCYQDVDKLWAVPDGVNGRTISQCWNCIHKQMADFGYSRSQMIRYTKMAEINKDLEEEIEESGLCENDFVPNELMFNTILVRCTECGYNWTILKPYRIHNKDKCRKKHCPECGGHVKSSRRKPRTHWISAVSFDGTRYSFWATASAANSIGL